MLRGVVVQNELDRSLESARGHAERVAAVRRRAFGERVAERREIERDLHDGAQHHLVALGMTLGLLELYARNNDPAGQQNQLRRLRKGLDRAENALYLTATGGSPLLQEAGVYPALTAEFNDAGAQIRLEVSEWDTTRRYEVAVELAVYFICLEAVNNARKYAGGAEVVVRLANSPAGLAFSVTDTGPGLEAGDLQGSSGMANIRRRIVAVGGRLQVRSAPGAGTAVHGFIPF
nr:ATP-binding protein [Kineosporia mesophila]